MGGGRGVLGRSEDWGGGWGGCVGGGTGCVREE